MEFMGWPNGEGRFYFQSFVTRRVYFITITEVSIIPINLCFLTCPTFPEEGLKF